MYESSKRALLSSGWVAQEGPPLHIFSSCVSGICAQVVCHPLDTLKTLVVAQAPGARTGALALAGQLMASGGLRRDPEGRDHG